MNKKTHKQHVPSPSGGLGWANSSFFTLHSSLKNTPPNNRSDNAVVLGRYSPSQNGIVVSPYGIALCLAGGGKGHDTDKPKILVEYE